MSKKVIIVGAGVAGLSSAFYARRAGFEVTVYEQGNSPGGVSTSWVRQGFTFDGGIHWLVGSSPRFQLFHQRWVETGALQANNPIEYADPVFEFRTANATLHLWRNIDRLTNELIDFAPEDRKALRSLCRHVLALADYLPAPSGLADRAGRILCLPVLLPLFIYLYRTTTRQYVERFSNPIVREFLSSVLNVEQNALSLIGTLGGYSMGDNGYPVGGSRRLADNMEQTVLQAGCRIVYRTKVEKICVEPLPGKPSRSRVTGVMVGGAFQPADFVIVAIDTCTALQTLFDNPLQESWAQKLMRRTDSEHCSLFSLGIKKDLDHLPFTLRIHLREPMELAGQTYSTLWVYRYSGRDGYAPEGCTSLTVLFPGDTYDYWQAARNDGQYRNRKKAFMEEAQRLLTEYLPEIEGQVAVTDLATPLTYERYCGCYRGGYMGIWRAGQNPFAVPVKSKSVQGLRFAGMRTLMPGGLPISVQSGYKAAKSL